jgi:hypothetical protein
MADAQVYNSKTTQNTSFASSSGGAFDGTYLSSKGGSGLAGVSNGGITSKAVACSKPMNPATCIAVWPKTRAFRSSAGFHTRQMARTVAFQNQINNLFTNMDPESQQRLRSLLREWQPQGELPPRFESEVWHRIALAQEKRDSRWNFDWLFRIVNQPRLAFAVVLTVMILGSGLATLRAEENYHHEMVTSQSRYIVRCKRPIGSRPERPFPIPSALPWPPAAPLSAARPHRLRLHARWAAACKERSPSLK